MQSMTFKQVMDRDVDETFLNVAEFADLHNIDGNNVPALIDDMENIEREKQMKSNMDGMSSTAPFPTSGRRMIGCWILNYTAKATGRMLFPTGCRNWISWIIPLCASW